MADAGPAPVERPEPDEPRKALVARWQERIDAAMKRAEKRHKAYEDRRRKVRGVVSAGDVSNKVRTNLIYSTIAAILPQVYAKNPDISVAPSEAVSEERYKAVKQFCATLEAVIGRVLVKDGKLKRRAKACVRSAMTTSTGWMKVTYQRDIRQDPIIVNRMNDVQDNLQRLQAQIKRIDDPQSAGNLDAERAQLEVMLTSLTAQVEQVISEGLALDTVLSEHMLILDDTVRGFDEYQQVSAIAQIVWFDAAKFESTFGYKPEKATSYSSMTVDKEAENSLSQNVKLYRVFEVWCKDDNTVFTLCKGEQDFCRDPYQPEKLGEHWYPFFPLAFNLVDGQFEPMSDVELIDQLADEYNETRTQLADHRVDSMPVRVVRAGGSLTPEDVEKIQQRKSREIVVLTGAGGKPLREDMEELSAVTLNPAVYDTSPIRSDVDVMSGATDALRGTVQKAKTATEAEFLQAGLAGRTGERQDAIADWIGDIAQYAAEILVQTLTVEQVQKIAGQDAQWPQMSIDDALSMVSIEIRAGTMGKPNKAQEQESWGKVLPLMQEGMKQVTELRAGGLNDMADAAVELLRETLRRFDERIDLDRFIPPTPERGEVDPGALQAENAQIKQALEQMQGEQQAMQQEKAQVEAAKGSLEAQNKVALAEDARRKAEMAAEQAMTETETQQVVAELTAKFREIEFAIREALAQVAKAPEAPAPAADDGAEQEREQAQVMQAEQAAAQTQALMESLMQMHAEAQATMAAAIEAISAPKPAKAIQITGPSGAVYTGAMQ